MPLLLSILFCLILIALQRIIGARSNGEFLRYSPKQELYNYLFTHFKVETFIEGLFELRTIEQIDDGSPARYFAVIAAPGEEMALQIEHHSLVDRQEVFIKASGWQFSILMSLGQLEFRINADKASDRAWLKVLNTRLQREFEQLGALWEEMPLEPELLEYKQSDETNEFEQQKPVMSKPGSLYWFEIPCYDLERAVIFYTYLFGVELVRVWLNGYPMACFPDPDYPSRFSGALVAGWGYIPRNNGVLLYLNAREDLASYQFKIPQLGGLLNGEIYTPDNAIQFFIDSEGNRMAIRQALHHAHLRHSA